MVNPSHTPQRRRRKSQRRKLAIASWRPPRDGRIYTRLEVDATPIIDYASSLSGTTGVRVTPTHVIGKAVAAGVEAVPAFGVRIVFGRLVPYPSVDISFAVDLAGGDNLAPVTLRSVDAMSVPDIARAVADRADRLRAGSDRDFRVSNAWVRLAPRILARLALGFVSLWNGGLGFRSFGQPGFPLGGAFISNVGSLGLDEGFLAPVPFARCPLYVCIGAVRQRPVVVDGEVVARPVLVLTATADHRIIDGAQAARLAAFLRSALAAPATLDAPRR